MSEGRKCQWCKEEVVLVPIVTGNRIPMTCKNCGTFQRHMLTADIAKLLNEIRAERDQFKAEKEAIVAERNDYREALNIIANTPDVRMDESGHVANRALEKWMGHGESTPEDDKHDEETEVTCPECGNVYCTYCCSHQERDLITDPKEICPECGTPRPEK